MVRVDIRGVNGGEIITEQLLENVTIRIAVTTSRKLLVFVMSTSDDLVIGVALARR